MKLLHWFLVACMYTPISLYACYSDAECRTDQICNDNGKCVPDGRNWITIKKESLQTQEKLNKARQKSLEKSNTKATKDVKSQTGAACFYTVGFSKCQDALTREQAQEISFGLVVDFHPGKSCSEVNCPKF